MSDAPHKPLLKIRTFAQDQARAQHLPEPPAFVLHEKIVVTSAPTPVAVTPKPVLQATHIPAFHEIKKKTETEIIKPKEVAARPMPKIIASSKKKVVVRAKQSEPVKNSYGGTVITDSRRGEFKVIPSVFSSFKDWLKEIFGGSKKSPKYTVTNTNRRKGIIQKATSNTATIFTADNETLKEEIRRRQNNTAEPTHNNLTWSPNTEVGMPLLKTNTNQNAVEKDYVTISFKKRSSVPPPIITEPSPAQELTKQPYPDSLPNTRVFVPPSETVTNFGKEQNPPALPLVRVQTVAPPYVAEVAPVPPPVLAPEIPVAPSVIEELVIAPLGEIPHTPNPKTSRLKNGLRNLVSFNTNLSTFFLGGLIISFVLIFLIVRTFLSLISPTISTMNDAPSMVTTISEQGSAKDLAISSLTTEALYSALASEPVPAQGVAELRIVSADGQPLSAQEMLSLLNFNTNQNLNQSVTEARLAFAGGERAIILEVTDATTVFGGLLIWESDMAEDLASALETGDAPQEEFIDRTIGQTDVRILLDDGTPVLVYGFIDKNVVVITKNIPAFTALLGSEE